MTNITPQDGSNYSNKTWLKQLVLGDAYNRSAFGGHSKDVSYYKCKILLLIFFKFLFNGMLSDHYI